MEDTLIHREKPLIKRVKTVHYDEESPNYQTVLLRLKNYPYQKKPDFPCNEPWPYLHQDRTYDLILADGQIVHGATVVYVKTSKLFLLEDLRWNTDTGYIGQSFVSGWRRTS